VRTQDCREPERLAGTSAGGLPPDLDPAYNQAVGVVAFSNVGTLTFVDLR